MNSKRKINVILALLGLFSASLSTAGIRMDFDRDNQTYNWLTGFNYSIITPKFNFVTSFDGQSNLIRGKTSRWQENASADFRTDTFVKKGLTFITTGEYTVNGLNKRRVRSSKLAFGFSYRPIKNIEFKPTVHADNKKRSEFEAQLDDQGVGYGMVASFLPIQYRGVFLDAKVSYDRINLTNIPSQTGNAYLNSTYKFRKSDTVYVALRGFETAKKFYAPGGTVESITKQIKQEREGNFIASISLPASLRLRFDGNAHLTKYLYRGGLIDNVVSAQRDNSGRGEGYELSLSGNYENKASGSIDYLWNNAKQDYQGVPLDQDTDTGEISFHSNIQLSEKDSISGDLVLGVTSFSNPNKGFGLDDWDKKTILLSGRFSHVFSRFFMAGLSGGVSSFHQIYISGARSANNGMNDTYVLSPFVVWKPVGWLDIRQTFDIQANYLTFDFDRRKISTKNRIFRRASSKSEFYIRISDRLRMKQGYYYRYEDYGQLIWDDGWQQAVSWDRRRNGIETEFNYEIARILYFKPFFSWEKTGDYDHTLGKKADDVEEPEIIRALSEEQMKMIFKLELVLKWSERSNFLVNVSHRLRKFMTRPREANDYAKMSVEYLF